MQEGSESHALEAPSPGPDTAVSPIPAIAILVNPGGGGFGEC